MTAAIPAGGGGRADGGAGSDSAPDASLDWIGPYRGPCAFCGDADARHRVATGMLERVVAGDAYLDVQADHGIEFPGWMVDVFEDM